jgi:hypothetical protein
MEGFVLGTALAAASPAAADSVKIPANYGEFTALYNRTLNQMRGALNHLREVTGRRGETIRPERRHRSLGLLLLGGIVTSNVLTGQYLPPGRNQIK